MWINHHGKKKKKNRAKRECRTLNGCQRETLLTEQQEIRIPGSKNKPGLHEVQVHQHVSKAAPGDHVCSGTFQPQRPRQTDKTTTPSPSEKGGKAG